MLNLFTISNRSLKSLTFIDLFDAIDSTWDDRHKQYCVYNGIPVIYFEKGNKLTIRHNNVAMHIECDRYIWDRSDDLIFIITIEDTNSIGCLMQCNKEGKIKAVMEKLYPTGIQSKFMDIVPECFNEIDLLQYECAGLYLPCSRKKYSSVLNKIIEEVKND